MTELVEFLRARIAEEEAAATECGYVRRSWEGPYAMDEQCTGAVDHDGEHGPWRTLEPAPPQTYRQLTEPERRRAVADVRAKRDLIYVAERAHDYHETFMNAFASRLEVTLCLFAVLYSGHPDFRDEWRRNGAT